MCVMLILRLYWGDTCNIVKYILVTSDLFQYLDSLAGDQYKQMIWGVKHNISVKQVPVKKLIFVIAVIN